jgi:hypothetical protein
MHKLPDRLPERIVNTFVVLPHAIAGEGTHQTGIYEGEQLCSHSRRTDAEPVRQLLGVDKTWGLCDGEGDL